MKNLFPFMICAIFGYLVGGINPAYCIAQFKGFDIRGRGSGNAGASNAVVTMGRHVGLICALLDIFKAYLTVKISMRFFPMVKAASVFAGSCCILGHIFPVFMHFRGGKGLAALGGVILAYNWKYFLLLLSLEVLIVLITGYICTVALSASAIFTIILELECGLMTATIFLPVVIAIFTMHARNLKRIKYGLEVKISYLWKSQPEILRLKENYHRLSEEELKMFPEVVAEYDVLFNT